MVDRLKREDLARDVKEALRDIIYKRGFDGTALHAASEAAVGALLREAAPADLLHILEDWLSWWLRTDSAPAKMPDALHVRTALALVTSTTGADHERIIATFGGLAREAGS